MMPLPFVLGWLWCLTGWMHRPSTRLALAAGIVLGVGCYSYITSWVMMPFFLIVSAAVFVAREARPARSLLAALGGFALPLLPLVHWVVWRHPEMLENLAAAYQRADPPHLSALQAIEQGVGVFEVIRTSVSLYWSYFDPSFLFLVGGGSRAFSTGEVGVFLLPTAVLLPVGIWALCRRPSEFWVAALLLAGLFTAPVAATLKGSPFQVQRVTLLMPFAALVSAYGLRLLWGSRRSGRTVVVLLLVAIPLQFADFYHDYRHGYRLRSASVHDRTAFAEIASDLIAEAPRVPTYYLASPMYDVGAKWRFFTTSHGREDLLNRTRYVTEEGAGVEDAEVGSLVVLPAEASAVVELPQGGAWSLERIVVNVAGDATLAVLRRVR